MKNYIDYKRPTLAAFGLIALLGALPANAADAVMEEPPAPAAPMIEPPLNTWSGAYAGVTLGYGFSGSTEVEGINNTINTDGFLGGAFLGYNYQMENFVIGAEGDIGYNGSDGSNAGYESKSGLEGSLRARLGYVVTPAVMIYGTAGGAAQSLEVSNPVNSETNTMVGWTAGAGADMMFTDKIFGRVEYRYTDFGSDTFNGEKVKDTDNRIQFGLGVKF